MHFWMSSSESPSSRQAITQSSRMPSTSWAYSSSASASRSRTNTPRPRVDSSTAVGHQAEVRLVHRVVVDGNLRSEAAHGRQLVTRLEVTRIDEVDESLAQLHPQGNVARRVHFEGKHRKTALFYPKPNTLKAGCIPAFTMHQRRANPPTKTLAASPRIATEGRRCSMAPATSMHSGIARPNVTNPPQNRGACTPHASWRTDSAAATVVPFAPPACAAWATVASNATAANASATITPASAKADRDRTGSECACRLRELRRAHHQRKSARKGRQDEQGRQPWGMPQRHGTHALQQQPRVRHDHRRASQHEHLQRHEHVRRHATEHTAPRKRQHARQHHGNHQRIGAHHDVRQAGLREQQQNSVRASKVRQQKRHSQRQRQNGTDERGREQRPVHARHEKRRAHVAVQAVHLPHTQTFARHEQAHDGQHETGSRARAAQKQVAHDLRAEHRAPPSPRSAKALPPWGPKHPRTRAQNYPKTISGHCTRNGKKTHLVSRFERSQHLSRSHASHSWRFAHNRGFLPIAGCRCGFGGAYYEVASHEILSRFFSRTASA